MSPLSPGIFIILLTLLTLHCNDAQKGKGGKVNGRKRPTRPTGIKPIEKLTGTKKGKISGGEKGRHTKPPGITPTPFGRRRGRHTGPSGRESQTGRKGKFTGSGRVIHTRPPGRGGPTESGRGRHTRGRHTIVPRRRSTGAKGRRGGGNMHSHCEGCKSYHQLKAVCKMKDLCNNGDGQKDIQWKRKTMRQYLSKRMFCKKGTQFSPRTLRCEVRECALDVDGRMNATIRIVQEIMERGKMKKEKEMVMNDVNNLKNIWEKGKTNKEFLEVNREIIGKFLMHFMHHIDHSDMNSLKCKAPENCECHLHMFMEKMVETMNNVVPLDDLGKIKQIVSEKLEEAKKVLTKDDDDEGEILTLLDDVVKMRKLKKKEKSKDTATYNVLTSFLEKSKSEVQCPDEDDDDDDDKEKRTTGKMKSGIAKVETKLQGKAKRRMRRMIGRMKKKRICKGTAGMLKWGLNKLLNRNESMSKDKYRSNMETCPQFSGNCTKEGETYCLLSGQCSDSKLCALFPNSTLATMMMKMKKKIKKNEDKHELWYRKAHKMADMAWEAEWNMTCSMLNSTCQRLEEDEENYRVCGNRTKGRKKEGPEGMRYEGSINVYVSGVRPIMQDINKQMYSTRNLLFSRYTKSFMKGGIKVHSIDPDYRWSCSDNPCLVLKKGMDLDINRCQLRRGEGVGEKCGYGRIELILQHYLIQNNFLKIALIWLRLPSFKPSQVITNGMSVKARDFSGGKTKYVPADLKIHKLVKETNTTDLKFDVIEKCPLLPNDVKDNYLSKLSRSGFHNCKKLVPHILGCTRKTGYLEVKRTYKIELKDKMRKISRSMEKTRVTNILCRGITPTNIPIPITENDDIQVYPNYDVSDQMLNVTIFFSCPIPVRPGQFQAAIDLFGKFHFMTIPIKIGTIKKPPKIDARMVYGPPSGISKSVSYKVSRLMDENPYKYRYGLKVKDIHNDVKMEIKGNYLNQALVQGIHHKDKDKSGLLILRSMTGKKDVGSYFYRCRSSDTFVKLHLGRGDVLLLNRSCEIQFSPKGKQWRTNDFYLYICAWDGSDGKEAGKLHKLADINVKGGAYSKCLAMYTLWYGCANVIMVNKCEKKCDGQIDSDARLDECKVCYGGNTSLKRGSKTYRLWNRTARRLEQRCCKHDVICNRCIDPKDNTLTKCQTDCMKRRKVSCHHCMTSQEVCGECVGGDSKRTHDEVCKACTKGDKKCNPEISRIQPTSLNSALSMQSLDICIDSLKLMKGMKCTLTKKGSATTCPVGDVSIMRSRYRKLSRSEQNLFRMGCKYNIMRGCTRYYTYQKCSSGEYQLQCTAMDTKLNYRYVNSVMIKSKTPIVTKVKPMEVEPGMTEMKFSLSNLEEEKQYYCCYTKSYRKKKFDICTRGKLVADEDKSRILSCFVSFKTTSNEFPLFVRNCDRLKSNNVMIKVACREPSPTNTTEVSWCGNKRTGYGLCLTVTFDKVISVSRSSDCKNYTRKNSKSVTVKDSRVISGNTYSLDKKCITCPGGRPQKGTITGNLPPLQCSISAPPSITQCQHLRVRPMMKRVKHVSWNVMYDGNPPDDDRNEEKLKQIKAILKKRTSQFFLTKDTSMWSIPGRSFVFKMVATDKSNRVCMDTAIVNITTPSDIKCRLLRHTFLKNGDIRMGSRVKYCRKARYFYEWDVKDTDSNETVYKAESKYLKIPKESVGSEQRTLEVKLTVTAENDGNEVSCTTKPINIKVKARKLLMRLMKGQKRIRVPIFKRRLVLYVKTKLKPSRKETFEWTCNDEEGNMCIDQETKEPLVLRGGRRIKINVYKQLKEWQTYTFSVSHSRDDYPESVTKSIDVVVQDEKPPEIKCGKFKFSKKKAVYWLSCLIKDAENVTFLEETSEDSSEMDMDMIKVGTFKKRKSLVQLKVLIPKEMVTEGNIYKFKVAAENDYDTADDYMVTLHVKAPPKNCEVVVEPKQGIAANTTFTISVTCDNGENDEEGLRYVTGPILKKRWDRIGRPDSDSEIALGVLPAGRIRIKTRIVNKYGLPSDIETIALVNETMAEATEIISDGYDRIDGALDKGDCKQAMAAGCMTATAGKDRCSKDEKCKMLDVESHTVQILKKIKCAKSDDDVSSDERIRNMVCLSTKASSEDSSPPEYKVGFAEEMKNIREEVKGNGTTVSNEQFEEENDFSNDDEEAEAQDGVRRRRSIEIGGRKRRRRSVEISAENTTDSQSNNELNYLNEEQIQSHLEGYATTLYPIEYENEDHELKKTFHDYLPDAKRSLCHGMEGSDNVSVNTEKIALYAERLSNLSATNVVVSTFGERVMLGDVVRSFYDVWNCSAEEDEICNGVYIAMSSINGDIFSSSPNEEIKLKSNIFSANLINPLDDGTFDIIDNEGDANELKFMIEMENVTDNYQCNIWNVTSWTYKGCKTEVGNDSITCVCSTFGHIAVFEVPDLMIEVQKESIMAESLTTTNIPLTSTSVSNLNYSTTVSISATGVHTGTHSQSHTNVVTGGGGDGGRGGKGGGGDVSIPVTEGPVLSRKSCSVDFTGNYADTVRKLNDAKKDPRHYICEQTRDKLVIGKAEFQNCTISSGSVIVSFVLVKPADAMDKALQDIFDDIEDSPTVKTLVLPDGTKLPMVKKSFKIDDKLYEIWLKEKEATVKETDDDDTAMIIGIVAAVIAVLGIVIIVIGVLVYKSKTSYKVDPLGTDNYTEIKKNNKTTAPTYTTQPKSEQQQNAPSYGKLSVGSTHGQVQTTGIKDNTSYNNPAYTDIP